MRTHAENFATGDAAEDKLAASVRERDHLDYQTGQQASCFQGLPNLKEEEVL
jgi:hypothetical protein